MPTYSAEWDQGDYRANNDTRKRMGFGGVENGGQRFAERSQNLGMDAQKRASYSSDFTQSNDSRGHQTQGLGLLHGAASGTAPSQAAIQAQAAGDRSLAANTSMAGSVKGGPGARVAAMRAAMAGNAAQGQQIAREAAAGRASEMAQARGTYAQAAHAQRSGDLDAQRIQQQNELTQRGLNDAQQRFFEQQGTGIQTQDQNNQLQQQQLASNNWSQGRAATMADEGFGFNKDMTWAKTGAAVAQGGVTAGATALGGNPNTETSDEAAKNVVPFGSLGPMMNSGAAPASFDKLSPGGGMDVVGSLKAHSNFATQFQRDPSGGMMRSDMVGKSPIMYSPGEIKDPVSFVDAKRKAGGYANPDMTPIPPSPPGARQVDDAPPAWLTNEMGHDDGVHYGYLDTDMSPAQKPDPVAEYGRHMNVDAAVADARKADNMKEAEKIRHSFGHDKKPGSGVMLGSLAGMLGGFAGRDTMTSDAGAKRAAFLDGIKFAQAPDRDKSSGPMVAALKPAPGEAQRVPAYMHDRPASSKTVGKAAQVEIARGDKTEEPSREAVEAAKREAQSPSPVQVQAQVPAPPSAWSQAIAKVPPMTITPSDKKAKTVIDLKDDVTMTDPKDEAKFQAWKKQHAHPQDDGEDYDLRGAWKAGLKPGADGHWPDTFKRPNHPTFSNESKYADNEGARPGRWDGDTFIPHRGATSDGSGMRDGSSDPRINSFDKTFHRDTKADQARVKKGVEDKAGKDADAMIASFKRGSEQSFDADRDARGDAPDLSAAAKAAKGAIPDDAMYRAMKSMKPSLYAYKPGFTPPEQHVGEVQAGPMANPMAKDPVAGTAIVREPRTKLLAIDKDKALKLTMGSLAVLAEDLEAMKRKLGGGRKS